MSDLTKNKKANALVWAAFFAFWLHSLHCCRADAGLEPVAHSHCFSLNCGAVSAFHADFHDSRRFSSPPNDSESRAPSHCDRVSFLAPSRFKSAVATRSASLGRNGDAEKPICASPCPISRLGTEKNISVRCDFLSHRTFATASAPDARFVPAVAFSTRLTDVAATPLYLRLRKLLN